MDGHPSERRTKRFIVTYPGDRGYGTDEAAFEDACRLLEAEGVGVYNCRMVRLEELEEGAKQQLFEVLRRYADYRNPVMVLYESADNMPPGVKWKNASVEVLSGSGRGGLDDQDIADERQYLTSEQRGAVRDQDPAKLSTHLINLRRLWVSRHVTIVRNLQEMNLDHKFLAAILGVSEEHAAALWAGCADPNLLKPSHQKKEEAAVNEYDDFDDELDDDLDDDLDDELDDDLDDELDELDELDDFLE